MPERRAKIDKAHAQLSVRKQCELLSVNRSSVYSSERTTPAEEATLMNAIRDYWEKWPFYGYRKITQVLKTEGWEVNHKRVQRLMQHMELYALPRRPKTSVKHKTREVYPYLIKKGLIDQPNQAWMVDITYLPFQSGFMYLAALIDMHSRYVVGWSISNTLETQVCLDALEEALWAGHPTIINSDQGCQFTSDAWIEALKALGIQISMTGVGRCIDNIYIERFWRSLKYEEVYLKCYDTVLELRRAVAAYIEFYNHQRPHQSLDYKTPAQLFRVLEKKPVDMCTNRLAGSPVLHTYPQAQAIFN